MSRTFKLESPLMQGADVRAWQHTLHEQLARWGVDDTSKIDGVYGIATRSLTATVLTGLGIAQDQMTHGVTPWLRTKVRDRRLSIVERARYVRRASWRAALKRVPVASPLVKVLADSWGYHPGVHDGIDLICEKNAAISSMTDGQVVRSDAGGWWGKAPSGDVSLGDGIIIVRCTVNVGPFREGMNICYGHAEKSRVSAGDLVRAGEVIGAAGLAVVPHIHLMVNGRADTRGVGDRDPRSFYDFARKNG